MSKIDMESRGDGQMENIQHMVRVGCVIAGKVRLFSKNTQVLARAHLDLPLTMFSTSESLFFFPTRPFPFPLRQGGDLHLVVTF